jgi:CRISPR-associated protein Cas2
MIILAYDIKDDELRTEFSKFLLSYGRRIQYSVYEINNSQRIFSLVKSKIINNFEKRFSQADSVFIFQLKNTDQITRFGFAKNEESDLVMY